MDIILQIILLVVGFIILVKGADWLIDGASSIASHFRVSKFIVGMTIVNFGTAAPELAVSISSIINGESDMLLGNVIGSNIVNILLLIGVAALIRPIRIKKDVLTKGFPLLLLITVILVVLFLDVFLTGSEINTISRADGFICLLCFAVFLFYIISTALKNRKSKKEVEKPQYKLGISFLLTIVGLVGVVGGAELVVNSASNIATAVGISDRIIALTIIAFGTSLPELITTIKASKRGETDLLVGNIVGSNIFNICIVLGLPVALFGTITPNSFDILDIIMLIGSTVILLLVAKTGRKITRSEGFMMITILLIYYGYLITNALIDLSS